MRNFGLILCFLVCFCGGSVVAGGEVGGREKVKNGEAIGVVEMLELMRAGREGLGRYRVTFDYSSTSFRNYQGKPQSMSHTSSGEFLSDGFTFFEDHAGRVLYDIKGVYGGQKFGLKQVLTGGILRSLAVENDGEKHGSVTTGYYFSRRLCGPIQVGALGVLSGGMPAGGVPGVDGINLFESSVLFNEEKGLYEVELVLLKDAEGNDRRVKRIGFEVDLLRGGLVVRTRWDDQHGGVTWHTLSDIKEVKAGVWFGYVGETYYLGAEEEQPSDWKGQERYIQRMEVSVLDIDVKVDDAMFEMVFPYDVKVYRDNGLGMVVAGRFGFEFSYVFYGFILLLVLLFGRRCYVNGRELDDVGNV